MKTMSTHASVPSVFWTPEMAQDLQILADYCGAASTSSLHREEVVCFYGSKTSHPAGSSLSDPAAACSSSPSVSHTDEPLADVLVLFGGSILQGLESFKEGLDQHLARISVIVGGYGHTTTALQEQMEPLLQTRYPTEAQTFQAALAKQGYAADLLETKSTNCGNNITYLLELLETHDIPCQRMIFIQDASMERRMEATLHKYRPDIQVLHCPSSRTTFAAENGELRLLDAPPGMWTPEKFASLLMGELQRLQDNEEGYGPAGKNFIVHLDLPSEVLDAYHRLLEQAPHLVRPANPAYSS